MKVNTATPVLNNPIHEQLKGVDKETKASTNVSINDAVGLSLSSTLKHSLGVAFGGDNTIKHTAHLTSLQPQGEGKLLAESLGDRQAVIKQFDNGVTQVTLNRPPMTNLVLSGGGAKGAAYPGALAALDKHNLLDNIKTMSGSSAGGITAALLASGMTVDSFKQLSDEMDLISLLDSSNKNTKLVQTLSSEIGQVAKNSLPEKLGSLTQLLLNIIPRLGSDAVPLEKVLREESRKAVLGQIDAHPESLAYSAVSDIKLALTKGGEVTFSALDTLSHHIPQVKSLHITGTGMFKGRPQLVVFNASTAPNMGIARAAHISGSFPMVFKQVEHQMDFFKSTEGKGEKTHFQDGGVMLNVPVPELIDPQFSTSPIPTGESLILKFEGGGEDPIKGSIGSAIKDWVVGAPNTARSVLQNTGLNDFTKQTVVVPLKTEKGDFSDTFKGTLNFTMEDEIKDHLQTALFNAVNTHIETQATDRQEFVFSSPEAALLALDDKSLHSMKLQSELAEPLINFKSDSMAALSSVTVSILTANENNTSLTLTQDMQTAFSVLDGLANTPAKLDWLAAQLNQTDNSDWQQLLNASEVISASDSKVLNAAHEKAVEQDVQVIATSIIREQIYPSLYRQGQTDSNVALLRRVEHNLNRATSKQQVNDALDDIISNYEARHSLLSKPLSSTTIEMAKSAKL
ncbi:patatin-like phospholipase family protein [Shewanella sp. SR44-3]|uniref:patatin-like phospholipase family protein n=1 Tax=Shewanella sp. SR44-3 TaxID=2760936 RepID=UPI001C72195F|nr:patatin-like phospholipase family protein [Shewanella sp. SR44-3]